MRNHSLFVLFAAFLVRAGVAQCTTPWRTLPGGQGTDGPVQALTPWDPDGAGPLAPVIAVGGFFTAAGGLPANAVALYDPATLKWSPIGGLPTIGVHTAVSALAVLPNGDLVAGGGFASLGGVSVNNVARWDGTAWWPLGPGIGGAKGEGVLALRVAANGDLIAVGQFTTAGGVPANNVARWDGVSWLPLGSGINGDVFDVTELPNGDLVVVGAFASAGAVPAANVARWDGSAWSALGPGVPGAFVIVWGVAALPNGDVIAGGSAFPPGPGSPGMILTQWSAGAWTPLATGVGQVLALAASANGVLVVGFFAAGSLGAGPNVARWTGATFQSFGSGTNTGVECVAEMPNGDVLAGGPFTFAGGGNADRVARWDGTGWSPLASGGLSSGVQAIAGTPNGDLVVGGWFTHAGSVPVNHLARWDGAVWSPLGTGVNDIVWSLAALPNGDVLAGGQFTLAGGAPANHIARWNGSTWAPLGFGLAGRVTSILPLPNGHVLAGVEVPYPGITPLVHRWNGAAWSALGTGNSSGGTAYALARSPNGDVIAAGGFTVMGGVLANRIARWNGASWAPLGTGLDGFVAAVAVLQDGSIVAGGEFTTAGGANIPYIARWNGVAWGPLGSGVDKWVLALRVLPDGDLVAAGNFTDAGGVPVGNVARWNGTTWSAIGAGTNYQVEALATLANGDLAAGGWFTTAGGSPTGYAARLTTTCPATAVAVGAGCAGTGGPDVLSATTLPWIGSTFASSATGLPALALALSLHGQSTLSVPLAAIHPAGLPGCALLVSPDLIGVHVPVAGGVTVSLPIPASAALVNAVVHEQVVSIELGAGGAFTALTSTNALALTLGLF